MCASEGKKKKEGRKPQDARASEKIEAHHEDAALWSGLEPTQLGSTVLSTPAFGFFLVGCLLIEMAREGYDGGLLSSHNGLLMKFFKSMHAINHYWYRTRYISKSVIGCMVLKLIGSTLVSLALGKQPSWLDNPSYIISFLFAFCLVRSDALEARELSKHMRYVAVATVALNFLSALYKMRSLSHLIDEADILGPLGTLVIGTIAFSACNMLMAAEAWVLQRRGHAGEKIPAVQTPVIRVTLLRHFAYLALLLAARNTASRLVYSIAKVIVLGVLFSSYNKGLLKEPLEDPSPDSAVLRVTRSPSCQLIMSTMSIPTRAKRAHTHPASSGDSWLGLVVVWVIGLATLGHISASSRFTMLQRYEATCHSAAVRMSGSGSGLRHRMGSSIDADGSASLTAAAIMQQ
mmetsp:Transcript_23783/g.54517  ORF Transcript_23783/g.54517 Transcript_23783/m.54517 type:complete len:404 (+) Transcript_23783:115-1326(+)